MAVIAMDIKVTSDVCSDGSTGPRDIESATGDRFTYRLIVISKKNR